MYPRHLLLLVCLLSFGSAAEGPSTKAARAKACPAPGGRAPTFTLPRAGGGEELSLRTLLALRRPVVIDFWRHDCAPCLVELPELQKLANEWGTQVSVVTVHHGDPEDKMLAALQKAAVSLPTGFDSYQSVGDRFCVSAYPRLFVVDQSGVIRSVLNGDASPLSKVLREAVAPLLAAAAKPVR